MTKKRELEAWAIVKMDRGPDDRGTPNPIVKKIFDEEYDAKNAVFPPYEVQPITIPVGAVLDDLAARITPMMLFVLETYKSEAILNHITGRERLD